MPLSAGTRLGPYEILSPLGAGGMGEVYRARDTRLDRTIAIKILPSHLSENPEARQRFDREARAISSLNHPNICTLHDVGHEDGIDYLVMEYLEGETLAERLIKGPLPAEQLLKYGWEICEGLEKAHKSGVIHRDLKPGNIMLTKTGAKLMDFGMAKAVLPAAAPSSSLTATLNHPEGSYPLTAQGTVLGTFQYMSPEQVEGKESDARSDIFSLGAVLYEMATGKRAFGGKTTASVIAAVLERDPAPISSVQPMSPRALDRVIKTCLAKDPDERFQTVHDLKLQLRWIAEGAVSSASQAASAPVAGKGKSREKLGWMLAGALALLLLASVTWISRRSHTAESAPVLAFIPPPPDTRFLAFGFGAGPVAVSPDGTKLAFSAIDQNGVIKLWVRFLNAHEATAVSGTENAAEPFWSPDSRSLGFFADSRLKTVDLTNGNIQVLNDGTPQDHAGAWGADGNILFAVARGQALNRISVTGGKPSPVAPLNSNDWSESDPAFLPDGKHFVYVATDRKFQNRVEMRALGSAEAKLVIENASHPTYAAGFLLFLRDSKLFAQPFDPGSASLSGTVVPLTDASNYSVGGDSVLAFQASPRETRLEWFDLDGKPLGTIGQVAQYRSPKISPDGKQVLTVVEPQNSPGSDLWSLPAAGGVSTRMTFGPGVKVWSVWSPDGRYIAYSNRSGGKVSILRKPADGSGAEETLFTLGPDAAGANVVDWSSDGRYLSYDIFSLKTALMENWILPLFGERKPFQVASVPAYQFDGNFSPDGHWLAYFSIETGRPEVYVVPFPGPGGKYQISHAGGWLVRWSKKNQLFFLTTGNQLMEADLSLNPQSLQVKALRPLFQVNLVDTAAPLFDVSADGQRVLAVTPARAEASSIGLLLNWSALASKK
ncbi:MAG: serine/threonine-protein kinase [Acidobacteriia bacterium]|nr:serine/threonine-protein kinase [Terriglobia bacterium]